MTYENTKTHPLNSSTLTKQNTFKLQYAFLSSRNEHAMSRH